MQIQNPMMFVRSIKGAPSSVLWVLVLVRQALTVSELCAYTGFKGDAVRDAVNVLKGYELVIENKRAHGEAYYSLGKGYQCLLPGIDPAAFARIEQQAIPESDLNGFCGDNQAAQDEIQNPIKSDSEPENSEISLQNPIKTDSGEEKTGSIIMMIDDESLTKDIDSSSIKNPPDESLPGVEILLDGMSVLQGWKGHPRENWSCLDINDIPDDATNRQVLAWIVKVIRDSPNLDNPPGLLCRRLRQHSKRKLPKNWQSFLPIEYLAAIGVAEAEQYPAQELEPDAEMDADDEEEIPWINNPSLVRAWQSVLEQLHLDMPRASFDTWVKDTRVVAWDASEKVLTVAARNSYARDWIKDRLESTISRLVAGMMACAVDLNFVTYSEFKGAEA